MQVLETTPLVVTLPAQDWNTLLFVLDEVAMAKRITAPLAQKLMAQLQQQQQEQAGEEALIPPPKPNGGMVRDVN